MLSQIHEVDLANATWFQGSRYSYPLRSEDTGGAFALLDIFKRQGTEPPPHVHRREHEIFLLLDGSIELQAGADHFAARTGAVAFLPSGIPHGFAIQQQWGHALVIAVPAGFDRYLLPFSEPARHLNEPPPPSGPPDIPGMIARGAEFGIEFVPPGVELAAFPSRQPDGLRPFVRQPNEGETLNVLGVTIHVKVSSSESAGKISMFFTEDPPKMGPPLHIHHREDETFYVLEGEYRVRLQDDLLTLKKGQMAFLPRGVPHTYANAGGATARMLVITTPGGFEHFFRDIDALCKRGAPAPEQLTPIGAKHGLDFVGPPIFT